MESLCRELKTILEKQKRDLDCLLDTAREQSRALRQLDSNALYSAVCMEEGLLARIRWQDEFREKTVGWIAAELGIPQSVTLSALIEKLPPDKKDDLVNATEKIRKIIEKLKDINRHNSAMSKQAIRFHDIIMNALIPGSSRVYTQEGKIGDSNQAIELLDRTV